MSHFHHHKHDHGHTHTHHDHGHHNAVSRHRIGIAALLTGLFMLVEVIGGLLSGSLALLADAGHMLTDFAALALAWTAFTLARRPACNRYSYGLDRYSVLAAFANGLALFAICVWILVEAAQRLYSPAPVMAGPMLAVAIAGLLVNLLVFWILTGADQDNLNVRGAVLHVLGDLLGSAAAIIAALLIMWTDWMPIDPLLSALVCVLILRSAWYLVRDSAHILVQGTPVNMDQATIEVDLKAYIPQLIGLEHMHVWCITQNRPIMTFEAIVKDGSDEQKVKQAIKARLKSAFDVDHVTVEIIPEAIWSASTAAEPVRV